MRLSSAETRNIRERLDTRRRELLAHYHTMLETADATTRERDSSELIDVANDVWDARVVSMMSERDALALENIVAAINRLDSGLYGKCIDCGDPVSAARLKILPEVGHCTDCARLLEERQRGPHGQAAGLPAR